MQCDYNEQSVNVGIFEEIGFILSVKCFTARTHGGLKFPSDMTFIIVQACIQGYFAVN